jgi:cytochrome P450
MAFLSEELGERRATPADDVISAIVNFEAEGRRFTEEECLGLLWSTAGAASDTTTSAIGHALYGLARFPDVRQRLRDDPSLVPAAVDEVLRLDAPAFALARTVTRDVTVGDVQMKAGDRVLCLYGCANRDDEVFPDPDEIALDRSPNQHLAFGNGIHRCLGMHLARMELRLAITEVLERIPDYRLAGDPGPPRLRGGLMWSLDELPITFTPGQRKSGGQG